MISVIIPTLNAQPLLVRALAPLVAGAAQGLVKEVIVVDGGSTDDTPEMADAAGCTLLTAPPEQRFRAGADAARADWRLFLAPESELQPEWIDETRRFIARPTNQDCAAAYALAYEDPDRTNLWSRLRAKWLKRPIAAQGLLIARAFYRDLGGHRDHARNQHGDLIARIGARRLTMLRSSVCV